MSAVGAFFGFYELLAREICLDAIGVSLVSVLRCSVDYTLHGIQENRASVVIAENVNDKRRQELCIVVENED